MKKKKAAAPVKEETPEKTTEDIRAEENPMSGEAELAFRKSDDNPLEDVLPVSKELPLQDHVLTSTEELPKDAIQIGEAPSVYEEDKYLTPDPDPVSDGELVWVGDPALLVKVKGFRDTLNGTLYKGIRK